MKVPKYRFDIKTIKMVKWFSPATLIKTALETALSSLFGKFADSRNLEAFSHDHDSFDYSKEKEIWFDYVADLGDGWNSTYTVAHLLSQKKLKLSHGKNEYETERGKIIIMGGDQVYPSASRDEYLKRMVFPYTCALPSCDEKESPHLYAIPGNHDWYDGLQSFQRLFCQERWIGGRQTKQHKSYFYLHLPGNWKIIALDIQFSADIDQAQKEFFLKFVETLSPKDKVILCIAEPVWLRDILDKDRGEKNLDFLEEKIQDKIKQPIYIYIAGDLHYYNRFESNDGQQRQKITAGGGGAFLHPTHMPKIKELPKREKDPISFEQQSCFPSKSESKKLSFRNLTFAFRNLGFSASLGIISLISGWLLHKDISVVLSALPISIENFPGLLKTVFIEVVRDLGSVTFTAIVFTGLILFADPAAKGWRKIIGTLHASAHFFSNMIIGWTIARGLELYVHLPIGWTILLACIALFVLGALISGTILGIYLFLCLNLAGWHVTESMSSAPVEDFKNFVRFHIDKAGKLTIYPVGIRKVGKKWSPSETINKKTGASELTYVPQDTIDYGLIEEKIEIKP